jgi:hypothetical protein
MTVVVTIGDRLQTTPSVSLSSYFKGFLLLFPVIFHSTIRTTIADVYILIETVSGLNEMHYVSERKA